MRILRTGYNKFAVALSNSEKWRQLRSDYEAKPTVRYGIWAIAGIFLLYLSLVIADEAALLEASLTQTNERLARVEQVQSEDFWSERLAAESGNIESIKAAIRTAKSQSLAKAQVQSNYSVFAQNEMQQSTVNVSEPVLFGKFYGQDVYTVSVELRGKMKKSTPPKVLESLAKSPYLQDVDRLELEFQQNRRLNLVLTTYFFIAE